MEERAGAQIPICTTVSSSTLVPPRTQNRTKRVCGGSALPAPSGRNDRINDGEPPLRASPPALSSPAPTAKERKLPSLTRSPVRTRLRHACGAATAATGGGAQEHPAEECFIDPRNSSNCLRSLRPNKLFSCFIKGKHNFSAASFHASY